MFFLVWAIATLVILYFLIRRALESIPVEHLQQKYVLITGCDSGFGHDLALRCLQSGMYVFAACLTEEGRIGLTKQTSNTIGGEKKLEAFLMDVRSTESIQQALKLVERKLNNNDGLHALVNNAGIVGQAGWDDWLTPADYEAAFNVNTLGVIKVTHAFKPLIKRAKGGRIVTIASVCARVALPAVGPYNVSKFAVEAYCDTIRVELKQFGVDVSILEPGFFRTPLTSAERNAEMLDKVWERAPPHVKEEYGEELFQFSKKKTVHHLSDSVSSHTEWVVDAYYHAITSSWPRQRYVIGYDANMLFIPFSVLPTQVQDALYWLLAKIQCPPKPASMIAKTK